MKTWLRLTLITMTVGGGFTGIAVTLQSLMTPQNRDLPNLEILASFFALYCYVIGSGLVFIQDPQKTKPLMLALAAQGPGSELFRARFARIVVEGESSACLNTPISDTGSHQS